MKAASCVLFLTLIFVFSGCDKYAEGPMISLMTTKSRISGSWRLKEVLTDGNDVTGSYPEYFIDIERDGSYSIKWSEAGFNFSDTGHWSFIDDGSKVRFVDSDGDEFWYTIVRLKNKELKLREYTGSVSTVYTYVSAG